jgi:hypothetical protein
MNALDLLVTAGLLFAWALVLMPILGFMRLRGLERRLEKLQDLTYTFTDASSRLSQALEQSIAEPQSGLVRSESSRRTLVHSARKQLDEGASQDGLTVKLGLRRDELSLMGIGRRAGNAAASEPEIAAAG